MFSVLSIFSLVCLCYFSNRLYVANKKIRQVTLTESMLDRGEENSEDSDASSSYDTDEYEAEYAQLYAKRKLR